MLTDSHCHLDRLDLEPWGGDLGAALDAARARGVERFLCIGIGRDNARQVVEIARAHAGVYASTGVHPLDIGDQVEEVETLCEWTEPQEVIAIGETGLDYYYSRERIEAQRESFAHHLMASARTGKPTVVHTREAREDTLKLIAEHADPAVAGVLHCFTESREMAEAALDLGFYISFSGIVTFKNAETLREVARAVPLERLLVETDSPYLAPVPFRGKKNEPRYVREVAAFVAELRGLSLDELATITNRNFDRLFLRR